MTKRANSTVLTNFGTVVSSTEDTRTLGKAPLLPPAVSAEPRLARPADHISAFAELQEQAAQMANGSAMPTSPMVPTAEAPYSTGTTSTAVASSEQPPVVLTPVAVPLTEPQSVPVPTKPTSGPPRGQPDPVLMPLMEFAPVGLFRFSSSGQLTHLNRTLAELLGAAQSRELIGAPAEKLFADPGEFAGLMARLERDGVLAEHDTDWRRTDGRVVRVRLRVRKVPATPERPAFLEGAAQDIHPFIRREQELLAEIAYLRKLTLERPDAHWAPTATRLVGGLQKLADALDTARNVVGEMVLALSRLPTETVVAGNAGPSEPSSRFTTPAELAQPRSSALSTRESVVSKPEAGKSTQAKPEKPETRKTSQAKPGSPTPTEALKPTFQRPPSLAASSPAFTSNPTATPSQSRPSTANRVAQPGTQPPSSPPVAASAFDVSAPPRRPSSGVITVTRTSPAPAAPIWVAPTEADKFVMADSPSRTVKMKHPTIELHIEAEPVPVGRVELASMDSSTDALPAAILGPPPGEHNESAGPKAATQVTPTLPEPPKGAVLSRAAEAKLAASARATASVGTAAAGAAPSAKAASPSAASQGALAKLISTSDSGDAVRTVSASAGSENRTSNSAILPQIPSRSLSSTNLPVLPSAGWLDVNELVRSSLPTIRRRVVEALAGRNFQVKLRTKLRATTPVKTNPQDIRDILAQLIGSAVRALSGPAIITLTTATIAKGTLIAVTDDRTTISEGFKARLFDPTFVTNNERVLVLRACGLAMNRYGGKVGVLSEPNTGTTVTMRFPRPKAME